MVLSYTQVLANLLTFEAEDLAFIDSAISSTDKCTLQELILGLTGLSEENKEDKIFVYIEKNYWENIILVYKKKYHKDTSTIADFLVAVIIKQYNNSVLSIF